MNKIKSTILFLGKHPELSMPLIILIWGIYYFFFGAVINRKSGLGFDGEFYGHVTKNFYDLVFHQKLDFYTIQRIFPSFVVNVFITILKIPKKDFFIVKAFQIYNLILLILCSFIWYRISKIYKFDLKLIWLGFVLGFVNFGIAKVVFFYPVLTDPTAFFLGFCLLYFHIKDNLIGKIITTFFGAFTWPTLIYIGILMIIFPINLKIKNNENTGVSANKYLAFLIPIPFFIMALYYINIYFLSGSLFGTYSEEILIEIFPSLLYISAALNFLFMAYFFFIFLPSKSPLSKYFQFFKKILFSIKIKNILICILLFTIINVFQKYFSREFDQGEKFSQLIYWISFLKSCSKPFVYIVTTITYFGPCFIILFFYLKNFKPHVKRLGFGVYLSFIMIFILIFESNPRDVINFVPFITLLSVLVLKDLNIQKNSFIIIIIFSLILSKVYIPMFNVPTGDDFFQFPSQFYFMNSYSISSLSYYIQGGIIIFMIIFILIAIRKNKILAIQET